jgi:outer membrane receptor for ferrienterochelin and colicins
MRNLYLILCLVFVSQSQAQSIRGKVFEINEKGDTISSLACVVYDVVSRQSANTNEKGEFIFSQLAEGQFIFNKIGFKKDTLKLIASETPVFILLRSLTDLATVEVIAYEPSIRLNSKSIQLTTEITKAELAKAACCNLGESFETNPSIDVAITDAVTGSKQIQLLGLAGYQTLITKGNVPFLFGNAQAYGLQSIPGAWIDRIYVSKGTGPVVNGIGGLAGQVNVELMDALKMPQLYLNTYYGDMGRLENNAMIRLIKNDKWQHGLFLHTANILRKVDDNNDGFLDNPFSKNIAVDYTFNHDNRGIWEGKWNVGYSRNSALSGEKDLVGRDALAAKLPIYQVNMLNERLNVQSKTGFFIKHKPAANLGIQVQYSYQNFSLQNPKRLFSNTEHNAYLNIIYQDIVNNTNHTYRVGVSAEAEYNDAEYKIDEVAVNPLLWKQYNMFGAFGEWQENFTENFNVTLGTRIDQHSEMGLLFTPRIHSRLALFNNRTVIRFSGGKAYRAPNVYSENIGLLMASKRLLSKQDINPSGIFEDAWNIGGNITQKFKLNYKDGYVTADVYHTWFQNQYVIDAEQSDSLFSILAQKNNTALAAQIEFYYEILRKMNVRMAFKYYNTEAVYNGERLQRPYQSRYRAFINFSHEAKNNWAFNTTLQWYSKRRLATRNTNAYSGEIGRLYSPSYFINNAQISKRFKLGVEVYLGVENIWDFKQNQPIIENTNPYGSNFDATVIYAPIYGRMLYGGINFQLK